MNLKQLKIVEKILKEDFKEVRRKVRKAVNASSKSVTLEDALNQIKQFTNRKLQ